MNKQTLDELAALDAQLDVITSNLSKLNIDEGLEELLLEICEKAASIRRTLDDKKVRILEILTQLSFVIGRCEYRDHVGPCFTFAVVGKDSILVKDGYFRKPSKLQDLHGSHSPERLLSQGNILNWSIPWQGICRRICDQLEGYLKYEPQHLKQKQKEIEEILQKLRALLLITHE